MIHIPRRLYNCNEIRKYFTHNAWILFDIWSTTKHIKVCAINSKWYEAHYEFRSVDSGKSSFIQLTRAKQVLVQEI